ncbi:MAG: cyclic nucleotide-binding domain-containing protein [Symploca sp. SIO2E9]|nr:cyclic nucleotide-binding domain-containing protein [Symploca sp. SIO2E9]
MSHTLLQELTNSDIDWLMAVGQKQQVKAGQTLIETGQPLKALYLIIDGSLTLSVPQTSDNALNRAFALLEEKSVLEREIASLHSGDIAGDELLLQVRAASTNVKVKQLSRVLAIPQKQLSAKLNQDVGFAARFYRAIALLISERLLKLMQQLRSARLGSSSSQGREVLFAFGEINDSDIDWMIANGNSHTVAAGTLLLQEGRPVEALYILLNGAMSVTIAEKEASPLDRAFAALESSETPIPEREIATLRPGEFIGEMPFGDSRLASTSVITAEESLVLTIPGQVLRVKLQQDIGFSARFERVVAMLAAERFRETINRLGYGRRFYSSGQSLDQSLSYEDELNLDSLDKLSLAGSRFTWMLNRLQELGNGEWKRASR